jgi:hypothetical protein
MFVRRRVAVLVAVGFLAGAMATPACKRGDSGTEKATAKRADERAAAQLLIPTDLPSVYATVRVTQDPKKAKATSCKGLGADETKGRKAVAVAAFQNATTSAQVQETISTYDAARARELMGQVGALPTKCATYTQKEGDTTISFSVTPLSFPKLLDETVAVKIVGKTSAGDAALDEVFMRKGSTLVVLVHGGLGQVDPALTEDLARRAAAKIT